MAAHTPMSAPEIAVEVDRYLAMPGQALSYKIGQREILRLRQVAREALGAGFDIGAFHDAVLGSGSVGLPVLASGIGEWVEAQIRPR